MKLLSLFDGSGGFPLAGAMCGIIPVAASEVEPFPIRVTTKRFPNMKHLGDISKINGAEIEPVDVITFGSPCQDLSVAGKRKGLNHSELGDEETTRSGLFMEAVRIIREMKEATNGEYPTFAVWENVPGAYSSNKGEDFRIVLEELEKTACNGADIVPKPPKGKWLNAGEIVGDNYSIAWRTLDAQFWGVPQRRRRIYLVADFRGKRAGKILFEREGLRGDFTQSGTPWQRTAGNAENGTGAADREKTVYGIDHAITTGGNCTAQGSCVYENIQATLKSSGVHAVAFDTYNMVPTDEGEPILTAELGIASRDGGHCYENIAGTLRANAGDNQLSVVYAEEREKCVVYDGSSVTSPINAQNPELGDPCHTLNTDSRNYVVIAVENHPADSRVNIIEDGTCQCLTSRMGTGGGNVPLVMETAGFKPNQGAKAQGIGFEEEISPTLLAGQEPAVCYSIDRAAYNQGINAKFDIGIDDSGTVAKGPGAVCCETFHCNTELEMTPPLKARDYKDPLIITAEPHYIVRRLTPLECCRLQGFPDWWCSNLETDNPTESDIEFWREVFETHRTVISGTSKPKTDKQIIKWLKDPYSDSAIYKMWGNGICLQNALYVMQGISEHLSMEGENELLRRMENV